MEKFIGCVVVCFILFLCVVGGCSCMGGVGKGYSEGTRGGKLIKVSKKGLFFKSYDAELQLVDVPLNQCTDKPMFGYWSCSTTSEDVGKKMEENVGKEVKVHYTQYVIKPYILTSDYEVVGVETVK
jgi:hypothetical protein